MHTLVHVYTQAYREFPVQTILIIRASVASEKIFWGVQGFWPMYRGKWEPVQGYYSNRLAGMWT